jgi:signal transduction histidine kinase
MLALFTDLMPVRRLENRVREMQSLADLGEMSAGIAHEFRNSLSTVLGYLNLARKSALPSDAEERVSRAETEARQLGAAVESLLAFARPMNLNKQEIDLGELAADVVDQLRPVAAGVRFELEGEAAIVDGDPILLRRVLENVLRNAVEAVSEQGTPGTVSVRTTARPAPALTITDDGAGIDPARVATLFLPFQSSKRNGFGLGLALARKIVLLHGGTISLTGRPQRGAVVEMAFPEPSPARKR